MWNNEIQIRTGNTLTLFTFNKCDISSSLAEVVFKHRCLKTTSTSEDEISHLLKVSSVNVLAVLIYCKLNILLKLR